MTNKPDMLKAALAYAEKGLSVIPCHTILSDGSCSCGNKNCHAKGKHPRSSWRAQENERLTEEQLRSRWRKHPDSNIGIVTGEVSKIIVIDIDGDKGLKSLRFIGLTLKTMPATPTARTGGGGYHLYYRYSKGAAKTRAKVLDKVDIRADGGIVIAPPSLHQSGKRYAWAKGRSLDDIFIADFDFSLLVKPESEPVSEAKSGELIPEGERNDWLFRRACGYRSKGDSERLIFKKVKIDYEERCEHDPPMSDKEIQATCHSATGYEPGANMLKLLPFEVEKLIQYGIEDAEYTLVIKGGESIDMGETSSLLSAKRTRSRLWERGYSLPMFTSKVWHQITNALLALVEIQSTVTALEETEQWLRNHLSTRYGSILLIDPDNPKLPSNLSKALTIGRGESIIRDKEGRMYLSLNGIIAHARYTLGQSLTQKALATRLRKMGFERAGVSSDYSGGKVSRVKMWMSPAGYLPPADADVETPAIASNMPGDTFSPIEDGEDEDLSLLRPSPTAAEEVARKAKERRNEERV